MAAYPIDRSPAATPIDPARRVPPTRRVHRTDDLEHAEQAESLDPIESLVALADQQGDIGSNGLADELLDYVRPRPLHPEALTQPRIIPLLGAAADLLRNAASQEDTIVALGGTALEQELRQHRMLAERRASLLEG
jgi:hypothetical protein